MGEKDFQRAVKKVIADNLWFAEKKKPEVSYVEIEVKILMLEERFVGEEGRRI
ncbi:MAG TPA: hypothetical protein VFI27_11470 [candidate division Zixibacteria bacterium]|nr:hypothetical protein [candidate division Zixibacteria bacterium]